MAGGVDIWKAIAEDDAAATKKYLEAGGDANVRDGEGRTPLFAALMDEKRQSYQALLENGADPNVIMSGKRVVTHWAAIHEDSSWLKLALEHGANANLVNVGHGRPSEGTPLYYVLGNGQDSDTDGAVENVTLLIDHGADVNLPSRFGCHPLADAGAQNKFRIVLVLLNHGADFRTAQCSGITFLVDIRTKCEKRDQWFLIKDDREKLDEVKAWLEAHGVDFSGK